MIIAHEPFLKILLLGPDRCCSPGLERLVANKEMFLLENKIIIWCWKLRVHMTILGSFTAELREHTGPLVMVR